MHYACVNLKKFTALSAQIFCRSSSGTSLLSEIDRQELGRHLFNGHLHPFAGIAAQRYPSLPIVTATGQPFFDLREGTVQGNLPALEAQQGKDAIAQGLGDITLIAVDSVHHKLEGGINNRPGFFGIESFNQRCRAFEIGKQGGNGFALAVGCTASFRAACSVRMRSARCRGV